MTPPRHIDKAGIAGATIASLCCLGVPAVVGLLSAAGLSFLINDAVLAPLLVLSVVLTLWGLQAGRRRHGRALPLMIGAIAGVALFVTSLLVPIRPIAYASIAGLVVASALNVVFLRHYNVS